MKKRSLWMRRLISKFAPRRKLILFEGDSLPAKLPRRDILLAQEEGENWCVGLHCPCGCGDRLEMMVLDGVKPRWDVFLDHRKRVSLHPSVWRLDGCRSHFWIIAGKVFWTE